MAITLFPQQGAHCFFRCLQAPRKKDEAAKRRVRKRVLFIGFRGCWKCSHSSILKVWPSRNYDSPSKFFHPDIKKRSPRRDDRFFKCCNRGTISLCKSRSTWHCRRKNRSSHHQLWCRHL